MKPIFFLLAAAAVSTSAGALPIPFQNCGAAGDSFSLQQDNASVWPPPVAAPARATATFDGGGNLVDLQIHLLHGLDWTFDSGPLPATTSAGFVSLPASFPMTVTGPALPIAAGPYSTTETFNGTGGSVTILSKGSLATAVSAPTATASLSSNGTPGFSLAPAAGDANQLRVQVNDSGGSRVFCLAITEAITTASPFTSVVDTVTPSAGANGSIAPSTPQMASNGSTQVFTVTPNPGFTASVTGSCGGTLAGNTYTTNPITASCTVDAAFAAVIPLAGGGSIPVPTLGDWALLALITLIASSGMMRSRTAGSRRRY